MLGKEKKEKEENLFTDEEIQESKKDEQENAIKDTSLKNDLTKILGKKEVFRIEQDLFDKRTI